MTTLVHTETGQSVTLDDASSFIASVPDVDKWIDADAPAAPQPLQAEKEAPQASAESPAPDTVAADVLTAEAAPEPAPEVPAHTETILDRLEHAIEDVVHKIEGEL